MKIKEITKSLGIGLIGGFLGAFGGADNTSKLWRRLGIPLLITLTALIVLRRWEVLSIMNLMAILSIGYGIPCYYSGDKGSHLGRFFYEYWSIYSSHQELLTNIFTRGTIGLLSCLTFLYIPIIKLNWITYIIGSIITIMIYSTLSWRTLGSIKIFRKYLIWSEIIPYSILTIFAMFLIF